ncbi:hypothetical protein [Chromobacterium haemolyticum]|uniref:hypothetical protein n=1 Tax=Chromobacterium haemolyticum TaxID=394935 RepID=UPI0011302272|nr:hypothetical protein [Chromobacterium haemolyticum]
MKNNRIIYLSIACILATAFIFATNFHEQEISKNSVSWSEFGSYFGGTLGPILSFMSIVLLIKSLDLQMAANKTIIEDSDHQKKIEEQKNFETQFFNLINTQQQHFEQFKIITPATKKTIQNTFAVTYIENKIVAHINRGHSKNEIIKNLETIDPNDAIFSCTRRFNLIIRTIKASNFQTEKISYYEKLINLTDHKLLCLIAIACIYFRDWPHVKEILSSGVLNELKEYMESMSTSDLLYLEQDDTA